MALIARYEGRDVPFSSCLPYRLQDGYSRTLEDRVLSAIVLESDRLRAVVLPEMGGRLFSLFHKPSGRELLHVNSIWQPTNIGIRGAWVSGGVEWNPGVFGHSGLSNEPVFAAELEGGPGEAGLRLWEYERIRGIPWQVDLWLRDGSDFLFIQPQLENPHEETIPMYWWTCLAVPELADTRVLAPATTAVEPDHAAGGVDRYVDLASDPDLSRPAKREHPRDTYFEIPPDHVPWIAAVQGDGTGTVHVSSPQLCGRKMWVWGMGPNGRRWQDWLAHGGEPYIEIQGGLAKKQNEYIPMPALTTWTWWEAVGPVSGVVGEEWQDAVGEVEAQLPPEPALGSSQLVGGPVARGSGWGALEAASFGAAMPTGFGEPTPDVEPWLSLLAAGAMPDLEPHEEPGPYLVNPVWEERLRTAPPSWLTHLHLGVLLFANGDREGARQSWTSSTGLTRNGWAERNLAVLAFLERDDCFEAHLVRANQLLPGQPHLIDETCRLLATAGLWSELASFVEGQPPRPRVRLARAQVALIRGDADHVRMYFAQPCDLADIRESETTLTDLWRGLCLLDPSAGNPASPPREYDFRMYESA